MLFLDAFKQFLGPHEQLICIAFRCAVSKFLLNRLFREFPGFVGLTAFRGCNGVGNSVHHCFIVKLIDRYSAFPHALQQGNGNIMVKQRSHQGKSAAVHIEFFLFAFADCALGIFRTLGFCFSQDLPGKFFHSIHLIGLRSLPCSAAPVRPCPQASAVSFRTYRNSPTRLCR